MSKQEESVSLTVKKKYTFNKNTRKLIFHTEEKFGSNLVFSENKILNILKLYSNFDKNPHTITDIEKKTNVRRDIVAHLLKCLNKTHDSLPFIEETVEDEPEEKLVNELINSKEFSIQQKFEKADWKKTQEDADKWRALQFNQISPVEAFLENWVPPVCKIQKKKTQPGKYSLIASLQDIHLGELTKKEHLFHGKDYNSEIACKLVDNYCESIITDTQNKNQCIHTAVLIVNGDFFHTAFNGTTAQGTKLSSDLLNEDLFQKGLDVLVKFISRFSEEFYKVEVKFLKGNHESVVASYLGYAIQQYFRKEKSINVEIVKSWATLFKVDKLAVIATHGGSDVIKHANIPKNDAQMKTYFHEMMLAKKKELIDCEHTIVVSGHTHSFVNKDMGAFDFYVMGTSVLGDKYADSMNFPRGKPRQNALIIQDGKVIETLHYYFD
jgi:predicted phosphodiesterase